MRGMPFGTRQLLQQVHSTAITQPEVANTSSDATAVSVSCDANNQPKGTLSRLDLPSKWTAPVASARAPPSATELLGLSQRLERFRFESQLRQKRANEYPQKFKDTCSELLTAIDREDSVMESLPDSMFIRVHT
jgi:hypothetical protein